MSLNKVMLIGRLGQDPEVKYTANGTAVCNFSLATSETYKDKSGERQDKTEWHKLVAFGRTAEICGEYLSKGKQIYIEGKIQTRNWEGSDGKKNYMTEVLVNQMQMLGSKGDSTGGGGGYSQGGGGQQEPPTIEEPPAPDLDDIPF